MGKSGVGHLHGAPVMGDHQLQEQPVECVIIDRVDRDRVVYPVPRSLVLRQRTVPVRVGVRSLPLVPSRRGCRGGC